MVDVVIIGSMGLDDVETPLGKSRDQLGGSAAYASYASSFFTKPGIVSIVGTDFPKEHSIMLEKKGIDLQGIKQEGKTFRWNGVYKYDMNEAETLLTELNCLSSFNPKLPEDYVNAKFVFLANIDPDLQMRVLEQLKSPALTVMDTMNFWIEHKKEELIEVIKKIDILLLNDGEARQLFNTVNLVQAGNQALKLGPRAIIIKKGEHGALLFTKESKFIAGGYPLEQIKDPTGCGDCFGGGFIGYLSQDTDISDTKLRKAIIYGSTIASFNAEDFGLNNLKNISMEQVEQRFHEFRKMKEF